MKIEVLFPEICNLCGDLMNIRYLTQCESSLEVVETDLKSRPRFLDDEIALVYLGSTTEKGLELIVRALGPVKEELLAKLEAGQLMLVTGNALDALGLSAENDEGWQLEGLGILPTRARYQMMQRHNSFYLGKFGDMDIVGFKSLFGHTYDAPEEDGLFTTVRGMGRNADTALEGWRKKGLLATYVTGPLLVLNPPFALHILRLMGVPSPTLAFEEAAMEAYRVRVAEFGEADRPWLYH